MCETLTLKVPLGYGNTHPVKVLEHSPKHLHGKQGKIACVSLHRGMAIAGSVELNTAYCCHLAVTVGCVVFNVEYLPKTENLLEDSVENTLSGDDK